MKGKLIALLLFAVLLVVALLTNPDEQAHKDAVKEKIRQGLSKALQVNGVQQGNQFHQMITDKFYEDVIWQELLADGVKRQNYGIFSISKISYLDKEYSAGLGIFGKVYIFNEVEKRVADKLNSLIQEGGGLKNALGF